MIRAIAAAAVMNLKGLVRTKSLMVLSAASMIYLLSGYFYYVSWSEENLYGTGAYSYGLMGAGRGMEVLLLLVMMAGLIVVRRAQEDGVEESSAAWPRGHMVMAWGQLTAITGVSGMISLIVLVVDTVACLGAGAPWAWIALEIPAVILQFFLPLLIGGWLGMCAAFWIPGRSVYPVLLILWCLLGNMGGVIWEYLSLAGIIPSVFWKQVMNLSLQEEGMLQQQFNAGPFREIARWVVKGGYALWLGTFFMTGAIYRARTRENGKKRWIAYPVIAGALGILMMVGIRLGFTEFYTHYNTTLRSVFYAEELYNPQTGCTLTDMPERSRADQVTVLENHLQVKAGYGGLKVTSTQKLQADAELTSPCFTLFRKLIVSRVEYNGAPTVFVQSKDALYVELPQTVKQGETFSLSFTYEGMTMPQVPVHEYTVQLQAGFPWFPWPGLREDNEADSMLMLPEQYRQDRVFYTLDYQGPGGLYVNLDAAATGQYTGESDYGLVMYSGMIPKKVEGMTVYTPAALYPKAEAFARKVAWNLAMYEIMPDTVGWLLPETSLAEASEKMDRVDTVYVIQDMINQENDSFTLYGSAMELRYINAPQASKSVRNIDELPAVGSEQYYRQLVRQTMELLEGEKTEELQQAYDDLERYLYFYCCYRGGMIGRESLPEAIRPNNSNLKLYPAQYRKLAEAIANTPTETLDAFFLDWLAHLQAGEWIYCTKAEKYEAMTDEAIYEGMMDWLQDKK